MSDRRLFQGVSVVSARPSLPPGCCVYLLDLAQNLRPPGEAWLTLSTKERERAVKFKLSTLQQQYIQCHAMLRAVLSRHTRLPERSIELKNGSHGKPELAGTAATSGVTFNLSHSGTLAVIAVAQGHAVGVDIEHAKDNRDPGGIAEHFFADSECMAINKLQSNSKIEAFYTCWCRKESFIKAIGLGLSMPLDKFAVSVQPDAPAVLESIDYEDQQIGNWQMFTLLVPTGYFGALTLSAEVLV